jgi:hypothetical protein
MRAIEEHFFSLGGCPFEKMFANDLREALAELRGRNNLDGVV